MRQDWNNVVSNFDSAAAAYDGAAELQRRVAENLIARTQIAHPKTIVDIGCGTGILTALAARKWPNARIFALDASSAMLKQVKRKVPHAHLIESDAISLFMEEKVDLVLSSLLLHWLPRPDSVLEAWRKLLTPEGSISVALPVKGTLPEWKELCTAEQIGNRLWQFPDLGDFCSTSHKTTEALTLTYPSLAHFLKTFHLTGTQAPNPHSNPASPAALRQLLRARKGPFKATYIVAYLL